MPLRAHRLDAAQAGLHHRLEWCRAELEGERSRVDACELEKVVDERREDADLLAEHGKGRRGLDEAVLERLEHGLHVRERRAEIVARPRHELTAGVEEPLQALRHLVERGGQVRYLGRPGLGRSHREVAAGESCGGVADALDRAHDRMCEHEPRDDRDGRRRRRDGENLHVVAHVERNPAGQENRSEREADRERCEPRQLQPEARQQAQQQHGQEADCEGEQTDRDRRADHRDGHHGTTR